MVYSSMFIGFSIINQPIWGSPKACWTCRRCLRSSNSQSATWHPTWRRRRGSAGFKDGGFHSHGGTQTWMVYKGNFDWNGWFQETSTRYNNESKNSGDMSVYIHEGFHGGWGYLDSTLFNRTIPNMSKNHPACGGFQKYGYPLLFHLSGIFQYKPTILGYLH